MAGARVAQAPAWLALLAAMLLVSFGARAQLPDFTELVERNSPAVVNISTTQTVERRGPGGLGPMPDLPENHPFRDFFDRFFNDGEPPESYDARSLGSGFIISEDGYVLTNHHVVEDADEIIVRLSDRREFVAEMIGGDPRSDLALLKIDAEDLPVVTIGESSELQVGEWVLAIGSPFGFEHSVTAGIVSAKGRSLPTENYVPFIQTDVAINPGNSGGPLFNLDGEVVGINSHIYSRTGGFMGLSFAIPIELAMSVSEQLRTKGRVTRGWLGVLIQDVTRDLAESFGMSRPQGALVAEVMPDSPAAAGGLQAGDVIVEYEGKAVPRSGALPPMVGRTEIGEDVGITVIRNGERETLTVTIGELPEETPRRGERTAPEPEPEMAPGQSERLGLTVRSPNDTERERLELGDNLGVVVESIEQGPASRAGIQRGDIITMLDGERVTSVDDFMERVDALEPGTSVPVLVQRPNGPRFLALRLPD
ncbi:DegQ family serine endoprotease [Ectothiorhodospiraceae bacterium WFHF3C12]|nr:DegQ family serine endoprotease [Ectothiorhodospiraceae bacterium WFHF3C12]